MERKSFRAPFTQHLNIKSSNQAMEYSGSCIRTTWSGEGRFSKGSDAGQRLTVKEICQICVKKELGVQLGGWSRHREKLDYNIL